ncbi:MAG: MBL fold metallo-hydrolase [Candidatus Hodarchaeota archaeon]
MSIRTVRIVRIGTIPIEQFEQPIVWSMKRRMGISGASSVTLIKNEKTTLLVDTGFENEADGSLLNKERNESKLRERLLMMGYNPKDIMNVFITHWHRDHFGNLDLFSNAKIYTSKTAISYRRLDNRFPNLVGVKNGDELITGVRVLATPGHTTDHSSLQFVYNDLKFVVAGDAVTSLSYYLAGKTWSYNPDFSSHKLAKKSLQTIIKIADVIIPGHGAPFFVNDEKNSRNGDRLEI